MPGPKQRPFSSHRRCRQSLDRDAFRDYVEALPFFDSHSHMAGFEQGTPVDDRQALTLPAILGNDYLAYLAGACADAPFAPSRSLPALPDAAAHLRMILPTLEACRGLTTYAALREGIRELHGIEGDDITLDNWEATNRSIMKAYRTYGERAWQRAVIRRAGVCKQVQICSLPYVTRHWPSLPPAERQAQAAILLPSLIIDDYFYAGAMSPRAVRESAEQLWGRAPRSFEDHLAFCAKVLDLFRDGGGNSVKILCAYKRSLRFEAVPADEAKALYTKGPEALSPAEMGRLQDALCADILELAIARGLPVLVHTGYSTPSDNGNPEHLYSLTQNPRLKGLRIGLCHAGWPDWPGSLLMARGSRGCYVDFSWTPLLSLDLARHMLGVAVDIVPMNKIMIGTDCGTAECFYGAARFVRQALTDVLVEKLERRQFGVDVAQTIARKILRDNAAEFFGVSAS